MRYAIYINNDGELLPGVYDNWGDAARDADELEGASVVTIWDTTVEPAPTKLAVELLDRHGNLVLRFEGNAEEAAIKAYEFLALHGTDPDGYWADQEGEGDVDGPHTPQAGTVYFEPIP